MKFKSALVTQASGSIGGMTAAHNRGGLYLRARSIPTDPGSLEQVEVRAFMSQLTSAWVNVLTEQERLDWDAYATAVPITDTLGEPRNIGGLGHYIRSNVPRLQALLARVDTAPTVLTLATLTPPTYTVSISGDPVQASVVFTNTDDWAVAVGGAILILASRGQNPSINYFKGPYRFAGRILGAVVPPTSPQLVTLPFQSLAEGQRVFFQARATNPDGRLSSPDRVFTTIVA